MFGKPWYWPWLSRTLLSLHLHQPTSVIYQIIITYLLHGNTLINYCLIPFRIKTFLDIFSSPLVLSTELEEKKKRCFFLIYILPYLMTSGQIKGHVTFVRSLASHHCIIIASWNSILSWTDNDILKIYWVSWFCLHYWVWVCL